MLLVVAFGAIVEKRTAMRRMPHTDLRVYLRAAWAVRHGRADSLYTITDDHGWHYLYPPLLAILATPLADPPPAFVGVPVRTADGHRALVSNPDESPDGMMRAARAVPPTFRFGLSVAIWYLISVACVWLGTASLARRVERSSGGAATAGWALRLVPVGIFIPHLMNALVRGQVEPILLLLFAASLWLAFRGRSVAAGLSLAGAICIKVIPAFLLLLPLWRRDGRWLLGTGVGLILGLVVIPSVVFGVTRTEQLYRQYAGAVLLPGMGHHTGDESRADELLGGLNATDNQSLVSVLGNAANVITGREPLHSGASVKVLGVEAPLPARIAAYSIGLAMVVGTFWAARWRRLPAGPRDGAADVLFLGLLILPMLLLSPVCHSHYFLLLIPLGIGVLELAAHEPRLRRWVAAAFVLNLAGALILSLPWLSRVERNLGLVTYPAIMLWVIGAIALRSASRAVEPAAPSFDE